MFINWFQRVKCEIDWFFNGERLMRKHRECCARERTREESELVVSIEKYHAEQERLEEEHQESCRRYERHEWLKSVAVRERFDAQKQLIHECECCGGDERYCSCDAEVE